VTLKVVLRASAIDDLKSIFAWIERGAGPETAKTYVQRIRDQCFSLGDFPNRGRPRPKLAPGLHTVVFERRAIIAYRVDKTTVQIVRILHHGRDPRRAFRT